MSRFRRRPAYAEDTRTVRRDHRVGVEDGHHVGGMHLGTHGGTTAPVHHHKRHVTLGDKISGAMMKLRGSLTHQLGVKVRLLLAPYLVLHSWASEGIAADWWTIGCWHEKNAWH